MNLTGFSTGAIALGDFRAALDILNRYNVEAIELSALRLEELGPLVDALPTLSLQKYSYISFHAPTRFSALEEPSVVDKLTAVMDLRWPIIVHPDSIFDKKRWRPLASILCFENMDKRKPIGRTANELSSFLDFFSESSICFDIGHASQIDRTMSEACLILQKFERRIRQVHISEVNTRSEHTRISESSRLAYKNILEMFNCAAPVIIESVLDVRDIADELSTVKTLLTQRQPRMFACW